MRKEKPLLLSEIKDKIDASKSMIIASYDKLEPNTSWRFRDLLGQKGCQFEVVKKRILVKAAEQSGVKIDEALLKGHVGVIFVGEEENVLPSAKAVFKFSEEQGNMLQVICGQVEGKMMLGKELAELSKLPGIDEMRAGLIAL